VSWLVGGWLVTGITGAALAMYYRAKADAEVARRESLAAMSRVAVDALGERIRDMEKEREALVSASWAAAGDRRRLERVIADKDRQIRELHDTLPTLLSQMDASHAAVLQPRQTLRVPGVTVCQAASGKRHHGWLEVSTSLGNDLDGGDDVGSGSGDNRG
jgi:hypothetical protein